MPDFELSKPMEKGDIRDIKINLVSAAGRLGTSVSTAVWGTDDTSTVSLGSQSLASNVSTCRITAAQAGEALIKITVTMANGEVLIPTLCVPVEEETRC